MEKLALFLRDSVYNWLSAIFNPYRLSRNLVIEKQVTDNEKIQFAFGIWVIASFLTIALQIPIFTLFRVEVKDPLFYIPFFAIRLFSFIIACIILHIGLLLFRIPSRLIDTFTMYSIILGSFAPFILLSMYPLNIKIIYFLKAFKSANYDFNYIFHNFKEINQELEKLTVIYIATPISTVIQSLLSCSLGVLLCLVIIEKYNANKLIVFMSVTFAQTTLVVLPLLLLKMVEFFIILLNLK
jgi:hypothetical protein